MPVLKFNGTARLVRIALGTLIIATCITTWLAESFGIGREVDVTVLIVMLGFGGAMLGVPLEGWIDALRNRRDE